MITELVAFLKAVPRLVSAIESLADAGTAMAAQQRRGEKDELVEDLLSRARSRRVERLHRDEVPGSGGDSCGESEGVG